MPRRSFWTEGGKLSSTFRAAPSGIEIPVNIWDQRVMGLAYHFQVVFQRQDRHSSFAHNRMIVRDQDPNRFLQGPYNPSGTSYATCSMAVSASNPFAHVHHDLRAWCLQYEKNTIENAMPNKIPTTPAAIGTPSLFSFDNIRIPNNKKPPAKPAKLDAVVIFRNHFCALICSSPAFRHFQW
jgi:hypothetical protein